MACAMLFADGMKPVLFLAFLALGPALADQLPLIPAASVPDTVAALDRAPAAYPTGPRSEQARALLCGR
jgi:hypothetical protein